MSYLSVKELENITLNKFSLDFTEAFLHQQKQTNPRKYVGAATIWQDDDGILKLKFYCQKASPDSISQEMLHAFNGGASSGQIISSENYFRFEGRDILGRSWSAIQVDVDSNANMSTGDMVFLAARLGNIRSEGISDQAKDAQTVIWLKGKFKIPFNQRQRDMTEPAFSSCEVCIDSERNANFRTAKDNLVIVIKSGVDAPGSWKNRVLEAVGVLIGAMLRPQAELATYQQTRSVVVYSLEPSHTRALRLVPPIPIHSPDDFRDFHEFVVRYLTNYVEPYKETAGFWFRVLSGFHNSLENQGLIVATACEGVMRACFKDAFLPDEEFLSQCADARELVDKAPIKDRARSRLVQSLSSATIGTMANALRRMEGDGRLPSGLRIAWQRLRHKLAHASELSWDGEKTQEFVNDLYSCLELFYRLIMLDIGYAGRLVCYAKFGWPVGSIHPIGEGAVSTSTSGGSMHAA